MFDRVSIVQLQVHDFYKTQEQNGFLLWLNIWLSVFQDPWIRHRPKNAARVPRNRSRIVISILDELWLHAMPWEGVYTDDTSPDPANCLETYIYGFCMILLKLFEEAKLRLHKVEKSESP